MAIPMEYPHQAIDASKHEAFTPYRKFLGSGKSPLSAVGGVSRPRSPDRNCGSDPLIAIFDDPNLSALTPAGVANLPPSGFGLGRIQEAHETLRGGRFNKLLEQVQDRVPDPG